MNDTDSNEIAAAPVKRRFRASGAAKLNPESARRQGIVTRLALEAWGDKDAAIAYLNTDLARLGGRPLQLATATADGLRIVEQDLKARTAP